MSDLASSAPDPLLIKIERFLTKSGMSAAAFGLAAINDPRFVYQLRDGREPRRHTVKRVTAYLAKAIAPLAETPANAERPKRKRAA